MFGMILNIGHTILYFIVGLRTISDKFRAKSESWYLRFRIVESIGEILAIILFFAQVVRKKKKL